MPDTEIPTARRVLYGDLAATRWRWRAVRRIRRAVADKVVQFEEAQDLLAKWDAERAKRAQLKRLARRIK